MRLPTICDACAHLRRADLALPPVEDAPMNCDAFPDGIPAEIWRGDFDHRASFPGDSGITFELEEGCEDVLQMWESRSGE